MKVKKSLLNCKVVDKVLFCLFVIILAAQNLDFERRVMIGDWLLRHPACVPRLPPDML